MINHRAESHAATVVDQFDVVLSKRLGQVRISSAEAGLTYGSEGICVSAEAWLAGQLVAVSLEFGKEIVSIGLGQVGDKAIGERPH